LFDEGREKNQDEYPLNLIKDMEQETKAKNILTRLNTLSQKIGQTSDDKEFFKRRMSVQDMMD
jgi:hypothetical protein